MKRRDWIIGIAIALAVAALLGPFAASAPDGLEWVAEELGFSTRAAAEPALAGPLPDYAVPAAGDGPISTALAGVVGTLLVAGVLVGIGYLRQRKGEVGGTPG